MRVRASVVGQPVAQRRRRCRRPSTAGPRRPWPAGSPPLGGADRRRARGAGGRRVADEAERVGGAVAHLDGLVAQRLDEQRDVCAGARLRPSSWAARARRTGERCVRSATAASTAPWTSSTRDELLGGHAADLVSISTMVRSSTAREAPVAQRQRLGGGAVVVLARGHGDERRPQRGEQHLVALVATVPSRRAPATTATMQQHAGAEDDDSRPRPAVPRRRSRGPAAHRARASMPLTRWSSSRGLNGLMT